MALVEQGSSKDWNGKQLRLKVTVGPSASWPWAPGLSQAWSKWAIKASTTWATPNSLTQLPAWVRIRGQSRQPQHRDRNRGTTQRDSHRKNKLSSKALLWADLALQAPPDPWGKAQQRKETLSLTSHKEKVLDSLHPAAWAQKGDERGGHVRNTTHYSTVPLPTIKRTHSFQVLSYRWTFSLHLSKE